MDSALNRNFILIYLNFVLNRMKQSLIFTINMQGVPAKMLQTVRGGRVHLDDSETHTNAGSETPSMN